MYLKKWNYLLNHVLMKIDVLIKEIENYMYKVLYNRKKKQIKELE